MAMQTRTAAACFHVVLLLSVTLGTVKAEEGNGQDRRKGKADHGRQEGAQETFLTEVPEYKGNVILGRPTEKSVTLSVLMCEAAGVRIVYGPQGQSPESRTEPVELAAGEPREAVLSGLKADAAYAYRVVEAERGTPLLPGDGNGTFHTARPLGAAFTFTVQADSHLDGNSSPELYRVCLANALADQPDFHIDLGDTFMTGKHGDRESAAKQYAAQRHYFGLIGHAAPVFLVLGNHDGEETFKPGWAEADGLAVWSCLRRKGFFPNPVPDGFFTGNAEKNHYAGLLQDYYAWTWGDALFVVLDPYWASGPTRGGKEAWNMTLGKAQYDWLAGTLRASRTKFKFVFIHQLVGGLDKGGRGGAEAATLYEWGGRDKDGSDTFAAHRPGWGKPIHALLVETGVTIVFHGHDHFFAHQELDGIVYQLVPQPAARNSRRHNAKEYGYVTGDFLPSPGHIRVSVSPAQTTVEYVRAATPGVKERGVTNGAVAFRYTCAPRTGVTPE
jgi:predicted phosphodiesterase